MQKAQARGCCDVFVIVAQISLSQFVYFVEEDKEIF